MYKKHNTNIKAKQKKFSNTLETLELTMKVMSNTKSNKKSFYNNS